MRSTTLGACALAFTALSAGSVSAVTVNFNDGDLSGQTYVESGFQFSPASLTSGQCPGDPRCLLQNNGAFSDVAMTSESGLPLNLLGFSYHFIGDEQQQRSVLTVSDTNTLTFTQEDFGNDPFTIVLGDEFLGVSEITFSFSGRGSGRLDDVVAQVIPLPASLPVFLGALGGLGYLARRRRAAA